MQFPNRRILKNTETEKLIPVEVERDEGRVDSEGTLLSAENMNDLEERIFNSFKKNEWKLKGQATGGNAISLPDSFEEIFLKVYRTTGAVAGYTLNVPRIALPVCDGSGAWAGTGQFFRVYVSTSTARIEFARYDNVDILSQCTLYLYYR